MPVFDAKNLRSPFDDHASLAALLHPTRAERNAALSRGRLRAERAADMTDPAATAPCRPTKAGSLASIAIA